MTRTEFQTYCGRCIPDYAQEHVKAGNWDSTEALEKASEQFGRILPDGLDTTNQYLFSIEDEDTGSEIGIIWFAIDDKGLQPSAFIYDLMIYEEFRRKGYGTQAMRTLEQQVKELGAIRISLHVFGHNHAARDLYEEVGYEITDVSMSKKLT